jgi:hypothetical protein
MFGFLQLHQLWKPAAEVTVNVQTTLPASTETAETRAIVVLGPLAQYATTDQSADARKDLKATLRSDVNLAVASLIQNALLTRAATTANASTLATSPTPAQSTLNVTLLTTRLSAGVHQG